MTSGHFQSIYRRLFSMPFPSISGISRTSLARAGSSGCVTTSVRNIILRVDDIRVFYDIDSESQTVMISAIVAKSKSQQWLAENGRLEHP